MIPSFWQGKRVFVTGHTGFKGSWLSLWLHDLGAQVKGYALAPPTTPSLFHLCRLDTLIASEIANIDDYNALEKSLCAYEPDIVLHLAAQALVRESYLNPLETYMTNVMGTAHVLEAVRKSASVKSIVCITTDKCYDNKEWVWAYRENEPMGGYDPYSSSKACSELVIAAYRNSFFNISKIGLASARAGNVIGGGDFSKDRLIPDFINAILKDQAIQLRYPNAVRPWQHVLESLHGYLLLAEKLWHEPGTYSEAWNFGPYTTDTKTTSNIVDTLIEKFKRGSWQQDPGNHPHEAHYLKLDIAKAETNLGWHPVLTIHEALTLIHAWYQAWIHKEDMLQFTLNQIHAFARRCS